MPRSYPERIQASIPPLGFLSSLLGGGAWV